MDVTRVEPEVRERASGDIARRIVRPSLAKVPLALDVLSAKRLLGVELVVRAAHDAQIRGFGCSTARTWNDVVKLEVCSRGAAAALFVREGALRAVAFEYLAAHGAGHAVADALLLELREERIEGLVEHGFEIVVLDAMAC